MHLSPTVLKYILSGLIASAVMFGALVVFREFFGVWYLFSSTIASLFAFIVSFLLQKFWTFGNRHISDSPKQFFLFLFVSLVNLCLNGLGMFLLVDKLGMWYLLAQFFVTAGIATWSFFIYRGIFSGHDETKERNENDG